MSDYLKSKNKEKHTFYVAPLEHREEKDFVTGTEESATPMSAALSLSRILEFILPCTWRNFLVRCISGTGRGPAFGPLLNAPLRPIYVSPMCER